jgi:hypothetical protein
MGAIVGWLYGKFDMKGAGLLDLAVCLQLAIYFSKNTYKINTMKPPLSLLHNWNVISPT